MTEYRVALRHTTLLESAALKELGDDRYFIASAAPPPTNSVLTLEGQGEPRFFLVDKVYEVESDGQARGVVGKLTESAAHEQASMLGTEHLEDGAAPAGSSAPAMAVPAPVVDPDHDDDEPDEAERQRLEASADGEQAATEVATPETTTETSTSDSSESGSSGGRKRGRRRGRKRR